jgi:glucosamine--fructose-6-phosphate aminotransferase (isomerizing)
MLPEMREFVNIVKERGADVLAISDDPELLGAAHTKIPLPMSVPEWLSPIPAIIPAQLFAMYLALERNYNPDEPRALSKVTKTW